MPSNRGTILKAEVQTPLLKRFVIGGLLKRQYHALFYEILHSRKLPTLPADQQLKVINYSLTYCLRLKALTDADYDLAKNLQTQLATIERAIDVKDNGEEPTEGIQEQLIRLLGNE